MPLTEKAKLIIGVKLLTDIGDELTTEQQFEVANLHPKEFGSAAQDVYDYLCAVGNKEFIPLGYQKLYQSAKKEDIETVLCEEIPHHCDACGKDLDEDKLSYCVICSAKLCEECVEQCADCGHDACHECLSEENKCENCSANDAITDMTMGESDEE